MNNNPTIFLIDDDTDDQEIFSLALNQADQSASCIFANDGVQALDKINADHTLIPDFIFIDVNMPRMNGQQCLIELKKIDRLKNVPVYMYSTSADPESVSNNKMLGADDYLLKPADIDLLGELLANIMKRRMIPVMVFLCCLTMLPVKSFSQDTLPPVKELKKLSVEELMNIVVTSASKSPEKLTEVASAIQVITGTDINRSAATRLPEALRLAPNMQVAQSSSHGWGISSRGFNGAPVSGSSLANKLLVMIDGRTVYTPLFGGVFWDVQNVLLEDIDRIEVVSGPGGTLWGANAVNGVVNILSKSSTQTQGLYASVASGNFLRDFGAVRYGGQVDSTLYYRVYAQRFDANSTTWPGDIDAKDSWDMTQGGFRMDYIPSAKNNFTLQCDLYAGHEDDTSRLGNTVINGQNILGRWTHTFSDEANLVIQTYLDRTYRDIQYQSLIDELTTYDIDLQHEFSIGKRNRIIWGAGYRMAQDNIISPQGDFIPEKRNMQLFSAFLQDRFAIIIDRLELIAGAKFLYNDYTDLEIQPSIRLAWTPSDDHTLWLAVSRAVRTPSRFDADNVSSGLGSADNFESEKVIAYELGYRLRPISSLSLSLALFYNQYTDLRSADFNSGGVPVYVFKNNLEATTYGGELTANLVATSWLRMRGGYTYLNEDFKVLSPLTYPQTFLLEAIDPNHQFLVQSIMNLPLNFELDGLVRYVDVLPIQLGASGTRVPSYFTFDLRLGWQFKWISISVGGQHLAQEYHAELSANRIPRHIYGKVSVRF